jgi:hypothetical protein
MRNQFTASAPVVLAISLFMASGAWASTYTFLASGTGSDGAEGASATITTNLNSIEVQLSSTQANPTSAGQEVSGIQIFLNSTSTVTLSSASGTQIDIGAGGAVTPDSSAIIGDDWGTSASGTTIYLATVGTGSTGTQPENLIIGPGPYTNANSSIRNFLPSIQDTGTFFLAVVGTPTITGVKFEFGTGPDSYLTGRLTSTSNEGTAPVPAALPLMGVVLVAGYLGAMWRRRRVGSGVAAFSAA